MPTATRPKPRITVHPLEDRVVILPAEEAESMRGPLYIPDTAKAHGSPWSLPAAIR
jgi:hypothetical protein